jgi:pyruvate dehydrogenase E2 component (dihydrolipoamide acetyltransferase)
MVAEHMLDSLRKSAQVTLGTEVDVTELVNLRDKLKQQVDITYTDLIVKAVALTLRDFPRMNAWVEEKNIRVQSQIHMGIAVALDEGLIVPVIRDADKKSLPDIARESRSLAEHARAGTLKPEEVTGSTFTITNLGTYGIDFFTPVINSPEVAILGVGRIVERPAQIENCLVWHQKMTLSLTFDHRAVDGAPAAEFLKAVSEKLTDPILLTP